jgi:hypothetical protein
VQYYGPASSSQARSTATAQPASVADGWLFSRFLDGFAATAVRIHVDTTLFATANVCKWALCTTMLTNELPVATQHAAVAYYSLRKVPDNTLVHPQEVLVTGRQSKCSVLSTVRPGLAPSREFRAFEPNESSGTGNGSGPTSPPRRGHPQPPARGVARAGPRWHARAAPRACWCWCRCRAPPPTRTAQRDAQPTPPARAPPR